MPTAQFGVFGLATMGQNLARNIASRGVPVALYNRTAARTDTMMREHAAEGEFVPSHDVGAFVASIETKLVPPGIESLTTVSVRSEGPWLVAVMV